jgi:hypothetical protein
MSASPGPGGRSELLGIQATAASVAVEKRREDERNTLL